MIYPYTVSARISQFPWRYAWHEAWHIRYMTASIFLVVLPLYWQIDKKLTSPENKAYWREKRRKDVEEHWHHMEKKWEVRT